MTECGTYQALISRMIDDDLDDTERAALGEHVKRCPDCAAVYVAFRSLSENLSDDLVELPAVLHRSIMREVRQSRVRGFSLRRIPAHKRWGSLLAAAACLILIVGVGLSLPRLRMGTARDAAAPAAAPDAAPQEAEEARDNRVETPMFSAAGDMRQGAAVPNAAAAEDGTDAFWADESRDAPLVLDAARSDALRERMSREPVWLSGAPSDAITLEYLDAEGEAQTLTVLLVGEEACYVAADGDKYYRIEGGAQALMALLEPAG